jgi:very-short-patch-repair endonuclease
LFRASSDDAQTLEQLHDELSHRYTHQDRQLRQAVATRLEELQHVPSEDINAIPDETPAFGIQGPEDMQLISVLQRMRERLLDLTARNQLLNYKHPRTRSVRVVHEVPTQVFEQLASNREMTFVPLEAPEGAMLDLFPQANPGIGTIEADSAVSARRRRVAAQEARRGAVADRLGIDTSFDLPALARSDLAVHNDRTLQTLMFPEELEKLVHGLYRDSVTVIEETGANMLHMMFGFLEWSEISGDQNEPQTRVAPLVLVPVRLSRQELDLNSRTYRYSVQATGEDWDTNVTLHVKCKREFGIDIPQIDPEQDVNLESYFSRVDAAIAGIPNWRVRRMVTLGMVSFGKILMWRDLDPTTWPANRPLLSNSLLRSMLGEAADDEAGPGDPITTAYPLDDLPEELGPEPPLIVDADSSQHSVLIDVAKGKNLVVQGPPGTGKSQTIANLIGCAMASGKRVLFIAEKRAALEVVHKRLREAGLEPFCLALHSHTSQKREFLDSLMRRLNIRGTTHASADIEDIRAMLDEHKDRLRTYISAVHVQAGSLRQSVHHVLWRLRRLEEQLGEEVRAIRDTRIEAVNDVTPADIQRHRDALLRFSAQVRQIRHIAPTVTEHPWYGVTADDLGINDVERIREAATAWRATLLTAVPEAVKVVEDCGRFRVDPTIDKSRELVAFVSGLPQPRATMPLELPAAILRAGEPAVASALTALETALQAWAAVKGVWSERGAVTKEQADNWERLLESTVATFGRDLDGETARRHLDLLMSVTARLRAVHSLAGRVQGALGLNLTLDASTATAVIYASATLRSVDGAALALRSSRLLAPDAKARISALRSRIDELKAQKRALDRTFDPSMRPTEELLRDHVTAFAVAPQVLPGLFSGSYRRARAAFRAMAGDKAVRAVMLAGMRKLHTHTVSIRELNADAGLRDILGDAAKGLDSPVSEAESLLEWRTSVVSKLSSLSTGGSEIADVLWECDVDTCRRAEACVTAKPDVVSICPIIGDDLHAASAALNTVDHGGDLQDWISRLDDASQLLGAVISLFDAVGTETIRTVGDIRENLQALRDAWSAEVHLEQHFATFQQLGVAFQGTGTEVASIREALRYLRDLHRSGVPPELASWIVDGNPNDRTTTVREASHALATALEHEAGARARFSDSSRLDSQKWCMSADTISLSEVPIPELRLRLDTAIAHGESLHDWAAYLSARLEAVRFGLQPFCELAEQNRLSADNIPDAYEATVYHTLCEHVLRGDPVLGHFSGLTHEEVREAFKRYDERLIECVRLEIAHQLDQAPPHPGRAFGRVADLTDEALIRREADKTRRHIPIRAMFHRASDAILAMKPCFLMGPQAVAQYLAPGAFEFDLIVIDEASQMRPEDALGALARGRQIVVVGDPKQLGPTSFFDRSDDDDDDLDETAEAIRLRQADEELEARQRAEGATVLERSESILLAAASRFPTRVLRWHYRSKHPKLIAFSNREFYDEKLILFPSADMEGAGGAFFHRVENGVYLPRGRRNEIEAHAVVEAVRAHARENPGQSLMVATLNAVQAQLIDELLEEAEKEDEALQEYRKSHADTLEPFAVKNLENVQGDERDRIMVSITFGRNSDGRLMQSFGPILTRGGERRLNVLFTRAKYRLDCFCSFDPADLRVTESSPRGLKVLRDYLLYAQGADWALGRDTGKLPDSDFEIAVGDALEVRGYEVRCQIGVAGFFIDLAVVHPDHPGRFILGIECDGATYHSTRSARDRDRLREQVLTRDFGWAIHRIWSTDWFRDPRSQVDRVVRTIERLRTST